MLARLSVLFATALVAVGCGGGPDAQRAQELLAQAQAAESRITSARYDVELIITADGKQVGVTLTGGAYVRGRRAGDQHLRGYVSGAPLDLEFEFVAVGKRAYIRGGGLGWQAVPRPAGPTTAGGGDHLGSAALRELARYVTDVRVTEGELLGGEPTARISGTVDTEGLVKAAAQLDEFSKLVGDAAPSLSRFAEHLGDTHVILLVSERSQLLRAMLLDLTIEHEGKTAEVQVIYRLRDVNEPVRIPRPL
jgi:hypothetical protein